MNHKFSVTYRKKLLQKLLTSIQLHEQEIIDAIAKDFKKPAFETVVTETNYVISDLKRVIKNIEKWAKPKKVTGSFLNFPSSDYIYSEPYGKVLVISPWNYPFQLAMCPLVSAVAAGNKVTLKPSELTPNTASILAKIIRETFEVNHVVAILGDATVAQELLKKKWDYIFFTGSIVVGKIIAKAAAENLTPITLELGGKSPCVVHESANLKVAAKRIIWGKLINAGQTCVAPDFILVHKLVKTELISYLKAEIITFLSENTKESSDFARIVNLKNWERQLKLLENQEIIFGGNSDILSYFLEPTLVNEPNLDSNLMQEEIFGPILPILSYETIEQMDLILKKYQNSLAFYVFSENKNFSEAIIQKHSFGGGCVNDTVIHLANHRLPFGGVGNSGIGAYHGKHSFDLFSNQKSIVKKPTWIDIPVRYAPYSKKYKLIKKLLSWM